VNINIELKNRKSEYLLPVSTGRFRVASHDAHLINSFQSYAHIAPPHFTNCQ